MIEKYVDAEELKRLISVLVVILGCLIIAGLFAILVVPGLRNANKPATPMAVAPVAGETGWLNPEEFPPQKGGVIPPVDPKTLLEPSANLIRHGKDLFDKNCTQCHGPAGRGDGPAAGTMNPKPRNFASPNEWKNGFDAPGIFKTLTQGVSGTSMASFDYLSKKDRMALMHYLQSLGNFSHRTENPQAMEALNKELAAAGETISNKIPVSMAMAKLRVEYKAPRPITVSRGDSSPGSEVLRRVLRDSFRAAQCLKQSQSWQESYQTLAAGILQDIPENGFSVNTAALSPAEWQALYAELMKWAKSE
jgi:mono/diheme cytochrome c family protein